MNKVTDKEKFLAAQAKAWDIYNELYPSLEKISYVNFNQMNYYVARSIIYSANRVGKPNFYCVCDSGSNHRDNLVQGVFSFKSKTDCETFIERMGDEITFLFTNTYFIPQAKTLQEAKDFYLSENIALLECIKEDGTTKVVEWYQEALKFFYSS